MICGINSCNDDGFLGIFIAFLPFIIMLVLIFLIIDWLFPLVSGGYGLPNKRVFRFGKYYRGLNKNDSKN